MTRKMRAGLIVWAGVAGGFAGVPEPDVIFYGTVSGGSAGGAYAPGAVAWTISGNNEAVTSSATTLVVVNTQTFYQTRIPFETRRLADNTPLASTPNTLALTPTPTTYARSARVDGRTATLASGGGSFSYGVALQGVIERVDLAVAGESFAAWSQRLFGTIVSQTADADGDGLSNYDEFLAGTDPKNRQSGLFVKNFVPTASGGFTFSWDSLATKAYAVDRSPDLVNWVAVSPARPGTGGIMSHTDNNLNGAPRMFYRVRATEL